MNRTLEIPAEKLTAEQVRTLETWIREGARWPDVDAGHTTLTPLTDDLTFLRRVTLDTVGVVPTPDEVRTFLSDDPSTGRARAASPIRQSTSRR